CLSQEAARWACVRGADLQKESDTAPPTRQQIFDQVVRPFTLGMDTNNLTLQVQWINHGDNTTWDWDAAAKDVRSITAAGEYVNNTVRVTIGYRWSPGILMSPVTLQSVCELPMSR